MKPLIPPLPAVRRHETMAEREKAHFLALDAANKRARRQETLRRWRKALGL